MADSSLNQGQMVNTSSPSLIKIKKLSTILLRRRYLILVVSGVVMSFASFMTIINKPMYQSSMQMLVISKLKEDLSSNNSQHNSEIKFTDSAAHVAEYTIQLKLMLSSKLIRKTVDLLRPYYPNITVEDISFSQEEDKKPPLKVTQLEGIRTVNKVFSQVFEISFQDQDPVKTQRVLQALQTVYQDYNIQQKNERLHQGLAFINARLPEIKQKLIQSQNRLEEFRKKHNLLDPEAQSKILLTSLADIQKNLQTTSAEIQQVQTLYANLKQKMASSSQNALITPHLNRSTRYQALLNEIQKTELTLVQEQKRYTDASPTVQTLKQQRQNQLALLQQEAKKLLENKVIHPGNSEKSLSVPNEIEGVDVKLMAEVIQTQTKALGLIANEKSLIESEQNLRVELKKYPSLIAEYNRLLPDVETNQKSLEQLLQQQQLLGLKIAQGGFDWQVLQEPAIGTDISNHKSLLLFVGVIAGPILGILVAVIWELFDKSIYSTQELQRLARLQLLGKMPNLSMNRFKKRLPNLSNEREKNLPYLITANDVILPHHQSLEIIYQNLQILKHSSPVKSLLLTSTSVGEGKTTLALGLAASAAHMHQRVLLIDANLQRPSLHNILEISNDWGLSLLLVDETNSQIHEYIQPIHPSIDVLTAGPFPEDTVTLFSSQRMKQLIAYFGQNYDLVLIDASAISDMVDARILAPLCDGIIMVSRIGQVKRNELIQAKEILSNLNLVGVVANEVS
ncbi:GumC family protein [Fortiea contorta]|uniref:GumC family protein n=1 Tax=Fortiea contorta TaxID=1892405 RepID=UPI00035F762B|nr:polysaccharide biosynthesis tyrosine autokinase [Fortiea contorta]